MRSVAVVVACGMHRAALLSLLDALLTPASFRDVAENGLQVEGEPEIGRVVTGVSANRPLIERAIDERADAIFVHHGLVWGGGMRQLTGWLKDRVALLLAHEISLFAYHLPLDAHRTLGNNAGLAAALDVDVDPEPFGHYKGQAIGVRGALRAPVTLGALSARVKGAVGAPLAVFGDSDRTLQTVGICSGGAPDLLHEAISCGLDVFITGEVTEWVKAVAEESGVAFIAAGHHATERFGAQRVADHLSEQGLCATFVDVENPA